MKFAIASAVALWLAVGVIAGAGLNATLRCETFSQSMDARWAHRHFWFAFGLGIVGGPVAIIGSPIVTAGFYDGLSFDRQGWKSWEERVAKCGQ